MCSNNQLADECQLYIFKVLVTITLTSFHSLDPPKTLAQTAAFRIRQAANRTAQVFLMGNIPANLTWSS